MEPLTRADWMKLAGNMLKRGEHGIMLIDYTNHRGERRIRRIHPQCIFFSENDYHDGPQWFLSAFDLDREDFRHFALKDIHEWDVDPTELPIMEKPRAEASDA